VQLRNRAFFLHYQTEIYVHGWCNIRIKESVNKCVQLLLDIKDQDLNHPDHLSPGKHFFVEKICLLFHFIFFHFTAKVNLKCSTWRGKTLF